MSKTKVLHAACPSPLGVMLVAGTGSFITDISLRTDETAFLRMLERRHGHGAERAEDNNIFSHLFRELDLYFKGAPVEFRTPVRPLGTDFELKVWKALGEIPRGETQSYGRVAERIGLPGASRAVGTACGKNPLPILIPCHRVIRSDGKPGGYTGGADIKRFLLNLEAGGTFL